MRPKYSDSVSQSPPGFQKFESRPLIDIRAETIKERVRHEVSAKLAKKKHASHLTPMDQTNFNAPENLAKELLNIPADITASSDKDGAAQFDCETKVDLFHSLASANQIQPE